MAFVEHRTSHFFLENCDEKSLLKMTLVKKCGKRAKICVILGLDFHILKCQMHALDAFIICASRRIRQKPECNMEREGERPYNKLVE